MAYEDFTTYTEVDIVADRIQLTAQHIDHLAYRNETTYLYKDKGAAHFGDFTHLVDVKAVSHVGDLNMQFPWILSNAVGDVIAQRTEGNKYLSVYLYDSGEPQLYLGIQYWNGSSYSVDSYNAAEGTSYYLIIKRIGDALTCEIYDNPERDGGLLDTIGLTVTEDTLRYVYGCCSINNDTSPSITVDIDNLDLQEGVVHTHSASDTLSMSDSLAVAATYNVALADTLNISDALGAAAEFKVALADTMNISDLLSVAATYNVALADTLNISDSLSTAAQYVVALADTMNMSDALVVELIVAELKRRGRIYGLKPARVVRAGRIGI